MAERLTSLASAYVFVACHEIVARGSETLPCVASHTAWPHFPLHSFLLPQDYTSLIKHLHLIFVPVSIYLRI